MSDAKIVGTGPIDQVALDILSPFGETVIASNGREEALLPLLDGAIALVVRGDGVANSRVIESAPELKVIGRTGAGYNNVDIAAATARRIPVVYAPGAGARAVAEAAVAMMLALCKNLFYWDEQLKKGNWQSRYTSKPGDFDGATLGIIGFGSIGRDLARLVAPFDMTVIAYDPYASPETAGELDVTLVDIDELMKRSDFISVHAPLTDETRGLINSERISLVKDGSYLVNLARGQLVENLDVLYEALKAGKLAGVGLDVFDPEPPDVTHPIFRLQNCITSPHALGMSVGAMFRIFKSMSEDMAAVLSGGRPKLVVNPEVFE